MDKNRKKRLNALAQRYVQDSKLLYLPSQNLEESDIDYIINKLSKADLITLKLSANPLGKEGVKLISSSPWKNITRLELKAIKLGPLGVKQLVRGDFKELQHLRLGFNEIGNVGIRHLVLGDWKKMKELWLQGNKIDSEGCLTLSKGNWRQLSHLSLWDNKIDQEGSKSLILLNSLLLKKLDITSCGKAGCNNTRIERILKMKFKALEMAQ